MEERTITKAEFDAAVNKVTEDQASDPKLEGMAKFVALLTGRVFADKIKEILFPEEQENKEV